MKVRTLLAAVMFLALSAAAFAQATFSVGSTPVTAVINTGITEKTGDITFTLGPQVTTTAAGTITVYYSGVPITNVSVTTAANIVATGTLAGATINSVNKATGTVVINIPVGGAAGDVITLTGIRVAVANTGLTSLNAQISTVNNSIVAGQTVVQVISAIVNGIVVTGTTKTVNAVQPALSTGAASISVEEGFLNAFGMVDGIAPFDALGIVITLDAAPPAGMSLTFPQTPTVTGLGTFEAVDATGVAIGANVVIDSTSTDLSVYYKLTADSDPYNVETMTADIAVAATGTFVGAVPVTAKVSLYPIGTVTTHTGMIPRYAALYTDLTLVDFTGSNTWLCVPFAQVQPTISYDTGLGIANTTLDPGGFATPQPGTIDFFFYPSDGSASFSYSTVAGSPGTGLDAAGKVPAGSTYSVLVSQLMAAARATNAAVPTSFSGYIFIQTNFTNGHGIYTVSNFSTFSQGGQILVTDRNGPPAEWWNN